MHFVYSTYAKNALVKIIEDCEFLATVINPKANSIFILGTKKNLITDLCLEFSDIFYHKSGKLTFTNEIKLSIDTNDSKPMFTKA